jgi:DNA-binding response OmpR family regulator
MPDICLIAADTALADAVAEQLKLAVTAEVRFFADPAAARIEDGTLAIILDAALVDKKLPKNLRMAAAGGKKPPLFLIGEIENGADENITESFPCPLRLGHLLARLQFHLQAARRASGGALSFGPWRLEPRTRQATHDDTGAVVHLTEKETSLLEYLGQSAEPVGRDELLAAIWGYDARIDTHTLETHIYRLRRKLDSDRETRSVIVSEQGAYRLGT